MSTKNNFLLFKLVNGETIKVFANKFIGTTYTFTNEVMSFHFVDENGFNASLNLRVVNPYATDIELISLFIEGDRSVLISPSGEDDYIYKMELLDRGFIEMLASLGTLRSNKQG